MRNTVFYIFVLFVFSGIQLLGQTLTQTFYVDFGKNDGVNGNITTSPDINGNHWNNVVSSENGSPSAVSTGYTVDLINAANETSGYTFTTTTIFHANGKKNGALLNPNPSLLGDLAIATATEDYFFIESSLKNKGGFVLKNLDTSKAYKFYLFGSRESAENRTSIFSINGANGSHKIHQTSGTGIGVDIPNTNDCNIFESTLITPKANGEISFEVGILTGGYAYINAMKIEEYNNYTLPVIEKRFYIDFGKNNNGLDGAPTINPDINGNYWNNLFSNGDGPTTEVAGKTLDIVLSDNTASPFVLETGSSIQFNGVRNGGLTNPDIQLLGDLAITTATHDYLFIDGSATLAKLFFKNMNKEKAYRFYIFGSRSDASNNRIGYVEIAGASSITGIHHMGGPNLGGEGINQNNQNIFVSDIIVPDAEGSITLSLSKWLGGYAHINAMKVEEVEVEHRASAITIVGNDITMCGQSSQMNITATPANAFYPGITWSVDNDEIAQISTTGKLLPIQDGTVVVRATAVFNDQTSISTSKEIVITNQGARDYALAIMGSSVPRGEGAVAGKGYADLLSQWLAKNAENPWGSVNISIGGNNTNDVLNRWDSDLLTQCARYVYYGLSLGNEGIHERGESAFNSYRDNMQLLISKAREVGRIPVIGNNYPRADFNATDYAYVKKLNLLIHQWDVPSVNLLGSIDDGSGRWASAYQADNAHPNTAGHAEMFYAFVPSLFDALAQDKPQPIRSENVSITLEKDDKTRRIMWVPENIVHSFTLSFSFKTSSEGIIASFISKDKSIAGLKINSDGKLVYEAKSALNRLTSSASLNDGNWHHVSLTHYYALGKTLLYVDGALIKATTYGEKLEPVCFYLNDLEEAAQTIDFSQLFFHRSGMTLDEIQALHDGKMLKSSLEIYAPLDGNGATEKDILQNLAQSLNTLSIESQEVISIEEVVNDLAENENLESASLYSLIGQKILDIPLHSLNKLPALDKSGSYILKLVHKTGYMTAKKIMIVNKNN